jgi:hypothetical protein
MKHTDSIHRSADPNNSAGQGREPDDANAPGMVGVEGAAGGRRVGDGQGGGWVAVAVSVSVAVAVAVAVVPAAAVVVVV